MILLVEDDGVTRENTRKFLADRGYDVQAVGTFIEAKEALSRQLPDVLILDVMLPCGRTGLELLKLAEKMPGFTRDRAIITTAMPPSLDEMPEGYRVMEKPFNIDELLPNIRETLDAHSSTLPVPGRLTMV